MEKLTSPLIRLMQTEGFKPFSGPDAIRIYKKAKERLNMEQIDENDLLKAVSSLGVLLETEIALMFALQNQICTKCGHCCKEYKFLNVPKTKLQQIAQYKKTSYKQIKKQTHARPMRNASMRIIRHPCPLYDGTLCTIYPVRPSECRSYPASSILKAIGGQGEYPENCEISDELLMDIAIKRSLEEKMTRENPEIMKELAVKKQRDLQNLSSLSQSQRLAYLVKRYQSNQKQS